MLVLACGAAKADQRRPAVDLYTGSLFRAARRAAQADGRPWLICSAEYGLIDPAQPLDPYERALADTEADVARLGELIAGQRHLLAAAGTGRELGGGGVGTGPLRQRPAGGRGGRAPDPAGRVGPRGADRVADPPRPLLRGLPPAHRAAARPGRGRRLVPGDRGLVYAGSLSSQRGQPVVDLAEGRWVDDGSLLGVDLYDVLLANGVQLRNVRPTSLTPAPTRVDLPAPRMAHPPITAAALPAARTTPTAARGPAIT